MEIAMVIGGGEATKHIRTVRFGAAVLLITLSAAHAQAQKEEHKLTLRAIMQELGAEHLRLTNALLIDDLKSVEGSARVSKAIHFPQY